MDKRNKKNERIGEEGYNFYGTLMKIIEYTNKRSIVVEFQDEHKYHKRTNYGAFKKGIVHNPYDKTVYGVGYLGVGKYNREDNHKRYDVWSKMIQRCYDAYAINRNMTYKDVKVCKEWHCFQNFAKWYENNYYEIENEEMNLDKDILVKGNKIYSPQMCIFVPKRINQLFVKSNKSRGKYPIGVSEDYDKSHGYRKLKVSCNTLRGCKHLGRFSLDKPFQAFTCYKQFKENYIKQVADEYKDLIPNKLYEALYKYEVEIND